MISTRMVGFIRSIVCGLLIAGTLGITSLEAQMKSRLQVEEERLQRAYDDRRTRGVKAINQKFLQKFAEEKQRFFQAGDLENAKKMDTAIQNLEAEDHYMQRTSPIRNGRVPASLTVEALIDGSDEFHVTDDGVYWVSYSAAKPGRHNGQDEPTYLNGEEWKPRWEDNRKDRGRDASATKRFEMLPDLLQYELLAIGTHAGAKGIENRSPISNRYDEDDERYIVNIPDGEGSSRWYRFRLYYPDLIDYGRANPLSLDLPVTLEYWKQQTGGLTRLNEELTADLEGILQQYLKEENLEKAEQLQHRIEKINAEVKWFQESTSAE